MLPPQEGPEPGYFACVSVLVTQSRANTIVALPHTSFPISDGYAVQTTTTGGGQQRRRRREEWREGLGALRCRRKGRHGSEDAVRQLTEI